jgi:hypothetical protein
MEKSKIEACRQAIGALELPKVTESKSAAYCIYTIRGIDTASADCYQENNGEISWQRWNKTPSHPQLR